jgi:hypothetical protein
MKETSPFDLTAAQIAGLLDPNAPLIPELDAARKNMDALKMAPQTRTVLESFKKVATGSGQIPLTPYTAYRLFVRTGDRRTYEEPYFLKRSALTALALRMFLGETDLKDTLQDYIWNVCEETTWVLPAHEDRIIDLFSAETSVCLAETLHLLGDALDGEVRNRVRQETEKRILDPYIRFHHLNNWYLRHGNWNGVCNSSVAMTFMLLEPEQQRVARALEIALRGLKEFIAGAFQEDGASTEGAGYWGYGLLNFVPLSEMLRSRSHGAIDLLAGERMQLIAAYPAKVILSGTNVASFSDCDETETYHPGILTRIAERTGEKSLLSLRTYPEWNHHSWRVSIHLRDLLWWDGTQSRLERVPDSYLPTAGVARLVTDTENGAQVVLAIKAGHNAENHNQNDVGSFILHVEGENLLTDPGRGLYSRQYFGPQRYDNIFAGSYGHSVPRIGGEQQAEGHQFAGTFIECKMGGKARKAEIDFARSYPVADLTHLVRSIKLEPKGVVTLTDTFEFSEAPLDVEEAFVTWSSVEVAGATATVRGKKHTLHMTVAAPAGATWVVEELEEASKANLKAGVLRRLTFTLPAAARSTAKIHMTVE